MAVRSFPDNDRSEIVFGRPDFQVILMEEEIDAISSVEECWNELQKVHAIENDLTLDDCVRIDENFVIGDYAIDADILDLVVPKESQTEKDLEEDKPEGNVSCCPSKREVPHAFEIVHDFMNVPEDIFEALNQFEHFSDQLCASKIHIYIMILIFEA